MPASLPTLTLLLLRQGILTDSHVTVYFGFKTFFFNSEYIYMCSFTTLSIMLLFNQINLIKPRGMWQKLSNYFIFRGEEKEILRSLSFLSVLYKTS